MYTADLMVGGTNYVVLQMYLSFETLKELMDYSDYHQLRVVLVVTCRVDASSFKLFTTCGYDLRVASPFSLTFRGS